LPLVVQVLLLEVITTDQTGVTHRLAHCYQPLAVRLEIVQEELAVVVKKVVCSALPQQMMVSVGTLPEVAALGRMEKAVQVLGVAVEGLVLVRLPLLEVCLPQVVTAVMAVRCQVQLVMAAFLVVAVVPQRTTEARVAVLRVVSAFGLGRCLFPLKYRRAATATERSLTSLAAGVT
jgi:hypothetical protein